MNLSFFRKLPRKKRQQLGIVAGVTGVVLLALSPLRVQSFGVGGLISYQRHNLDTLKTKQDSARSELKRIQETLKHAEEIATDMAQAKKAMAEAESDVATGDLYSWMINTLRDFKAHYNVDIPQFLPIGPTTDVNLMPDFPYKQATLSVSGTAHFHDLGKFLADLENKFPHIRVLNLSVELNLNPALEDKETVSFKMDIVTLVKSNPS